MARSWNRAYRQNHIEIDQAPSDARRVRIPATLRGVFAPIRDFFAMLPESRERGYKPRPLQHSTSRAAAAKLARAMAYAVSR